MADSASYRRRAVTATAVVGALAALILIGIVQLAFTGSARESADRVLRARSNAVISSVDAATGGGELRVPDAALGPGVAVYDARGRLVGGSVPPALSDTYEDLSTEAEGDEQVQHNLAVQARPFTTGSGASGLVVAAESLDPYTDDQHEALLVAVLAGLVIVVLTTGLVAWASKRVLEPVADMARTAEDWSEHDLDRRFALGAPTNEIRALGNTLDALLDKVARAILAEQRLTSELAHELRTPLTTIQATADLLAMRGDLDPELREDVEGIQQARHSMARTMTSLLELARAQADPGESRAELPQVVEAVLSELGGPEGVTVALPGTPLLAVPHDLAVRAVAPVLQNAVRHAAHVRLDAEVRRGRVDLLIADDGPGVVAEVAGRLFEIGHSTGGSGLGLALARRIARSVGGDVSMVRPGGGPDGETTFCVSLPTVAG